jgi:choice-of-anchor C domain-containing protein
MKHKLLAVLAVGVMMLGVAGMAEANLIANGSFEAGSYSGGSYSTLPTGSTAITDWTVTSGSIDWIKDYWKASDGNMSLDLAGLYQNGTIVGQSFSTVVGQSYLVQFDMAGNPDKGYDKALIGATVGGATHNFTFDQTIQNRNNMGWQTMSFSFAATSALTQLTFGNFSSDPKDAWGAALDNVRVDTAPVPEPGTMMLLGLGMLGLAVFGKRRMNKEA